MSTPFKSDVRGQYIFKTWTTNGKTYKQARGWLGMPGQVREFRSAYQQSKLAAGTGDDAGHLIGNRFGAPGGVENLNPQNWKSNRCGTYKDLENRWAQKRLNDVDVFVQVTDVTRPGETRPFMRNVQWIERFQQHETRDEIVFANAHTPESREAQNVPVTLFPTDAQIIRVDFQNRKRLA
jgi:beta-galactosidase GanA